MGAKSKIEVSYDSGFLVARLADVDTSEGMEQTTAGVDVRIRASSVIMYCAAEPGVVLLSVKGVTGDGEGPPVAVIGTVAGVAAAMKRDRMKEVHSDL